MTINETDILIHLRKTSAAYCSVVRVRNLDYTFDLMLASDKCRVLQRVNVQGLSYYYDFTKFIDKERALLEAKMALLEEGKPISLPPPECACGIHRSRCDYHREGT